MTKTKADTGSVATLEAAERAALAELPEDLAAVAAGDPARWYALKTCQDADRVESDEFRDELKVLRTVAIASDERQRQNHPGRGRPPLSDERRAYRAAEQDLDEAPDRAALALQNWLARIAELKTAAPEIARLDDQADEQRRLCEQVVKQLRGAAHAYCEANEIADAGRETMARRADLVTFAFDPFLKLDESSQFLDAILKRVDKRFQAESQRVGGDDDEEIAMMRARHEIAEYQKALDAAATAYRGTADGKAQWHHYAGLMKRHEASVGTADYDNTYERELLQQILDSFYTKAAGHAGLTPHEEHYPQLG